MDCKLIDAEHKQVLLSKLELLRRAMQSYMDKAREFRGRLTLLDARALDNSIADVLLDVGVKRDCLENERFETASAVRLRLSAADLAAYMRIMLQDIERKIVETNAEIDNTLGSLCKGIGYVQTE
jgi:hypothetical protein